MKKHKRIISCFLILSSFLSLFIFPSSAWDQPEAPPAYGARFSIPKSISSDRLYAEAEPLDTYLKGKSILLLGDSLFAGYGLEDFSQSWCGMLETQYGMELTRRAVSGSTFGTSSSWGYEPGGYYYPICRRELQEGDFDVILVTGSGNDWYCEIPLGTDLTSRDTTNLMGAINTTIDRLEQLYPNALILFVTSWNSTGEYNSLGYTTQDYNDTLMLVCQTRGILYFEACDPTVSGIDASTEAFRADYFLNSLDYWHLNAAGHQLYLPAIAGWLEEQLLEHYTVAGFYDVLKTAWYADAVQYAHEQGLVQGVTHTSFAPNTTMSRSMLITVLYRAAGSPDVTGLTHPFEDIPADAYYYDALLWGYDNGLIQGMDDTHFAPSNPVTREQLAAFLYRYAQAEGTDYTPDDLSSFTDQDQISEYARRAFSWAVGTDILHGMGNGTLAPKDSASRAQTVQLLTNYFRKSTSE